MAKVGIYLPAYNAGKYIERTINSIKAQEMRDWQLVLIDDASDDDTFDKAAKAAEGDPRISAHREEEHCGLIGKLKNKCISMLDQSEYICHVGAEDLIPPYCLRIFCQAMDGSPHVGAACGTFVAFDNQGKQWHFPHVVRDKGFSSERLMRYMCMYPHRFYRRAVVEKVGGYSDELSSAVDYDLSLRLDETTAIMRLEKPVTYYYRQHMEQVSRRDRVQQDANAKKALQDAIDRRGLDLKIQNDAPPFVLSKKQPEHFIWGKK